MALPVLVLLTLALAWIVCLGVAQVRVVDAARETARALARGEDEGQGIAWGRRIAPDGARFAVRRDGALVVVAVAARVSGPGGIGSVPWFDATAEAVAAVEPGPP